MFKKLFEMFKGLFGISREKLFGKRLCKRGYHKLELIDPDYLHKGVHCVRPGCTFKIGPDILPYPRTKQEK